MTLEEILRDIETDDTYGDCECVEQLAELGVANALMLAAVVRDLIEQTQTFTVLEATVEVSMFGTATINEGRGLIL